MIITSFEFSHIKSYKSLRFDLDKTSVLIGQNDHGKSSILKAIDITLNQLDEDVVAEGALHPDLAEKLLPIFLVQAKARRITINYRDGIRRKKLYITVRSNLTFVVHETISRNIKTTPSAIQTLKALREHNKFVLIPALRDASSTSFQNMFSKLLKDRGLASIIPQKAGGTPREYRKLKSIREDITDTIKPFIDEMLLPQISKNFGFKTEHTLAFKFDVDVQDIGQWVLDNLKLGFQITDDVEATIALSEAGTGVQSVVLLALHRLEHEASTDSNSQFILAVEEPEAFLHPQKQRELYVDILSARTENLKVIVTTHSPYIVADTPFTQLGLVRKEDKYSSLYTPKVSSDRDAQIFDAYSSDVNSQMFFADKIILVEGESDLRVIRSLLKRKFGPSAHRISVISASGNKNFSPFLRMLDAWYEAGIPTLVVTDFDSLTAEGGRAILEGVKDAGYDFIREREFHARVDTAIDKSDSEYRAVATEASRFLACGYFEFFVFTSDLEYALITEGNKDKAAKVLNEFSDTVDYTKGYNLSQLRRTIGSKGIPISKNEGAKFKRPHIHKKIADTIDLTAPSQDIARLLKQVDNLS